MTTYVVEKSTPKPLGGRDCLNVSSLAVISTIGMDCLYFVVQIALSTIFKQCHVGLSLALVDKEILLGFNPVYAPLPPGTANTIDPL